MPYLDLHVSLNSNRNKQRSLLAALSLCLAASVFIYLSSEPSEDGSEDEDGDGRDENIANLEFITSTMETSGWDHAVTRAYLRQVLVDIEHNEARRRAPRRPNPERVPPAPATAAGPAATGAHGSAWQAALGGRWDFLGMRFPTPSIGSSPDLPDPSIPSNKKRKRASDAPATPQVIRETSSVPLGGDPDEPWASAAASAPPSHNGFVDTGDDDIPALQTNLPHRTPASAPTPAPTSATIPDPQHQHASPTPTPSQHQHQQKHAQRDINDGPGVSIDATLFSHFGPRPFAAAAGGEGSGGGAGVSGGDIVAPKQQQPGGGRPGTGRWHLAAVCMYTQFLHSLSGRGGGRGGGEGGKGG